MSAPLLINQAIGSLTNPEKSILGFVNKKDLKNDTNKLAIQSSRQAFKMLAESQKFFIDEKLMQTVGELASQDQNKILELIKRAIPPFDNMFVEWNEKRRLENLGADPSQSFFQVGYHIQRLNGRFFYTSYNMVNKLGADPNYEVKYGNNYLNKVIKNKLHIPLTGFYLSNEEQLLNDDFRSTTDYKQNMFGATKKQIREAHEFHCKHLIGEHYCENEKTSRLVNWLDGRLETAQSIATNMMFPDKTLTKGFHAEEMSRWVASDMKSMGGDLRLITAILATLNYDHIVYNDAKPNPKILHTRNGKNLPKYSYRLVTIDLPKPKVRKVYKGIITGSGSPKAEHWRRGHWRVQNYKNGKKRIWIEPMKVGDKNIGVIEHDYILRGKEKCLTH